MSSKITTHYNIDPDKIENIFTHHPPFGDQAERYNLIRENAKAFAYLILSLTPRSAEQERALSHLDEAVASANMAIARHEKQKPDPQEFERLIRTHGDDLSKFAGCYGGHDPDELPGLSEEAGGDPVPRSAFKASVTQAHIEHSKSLPGATGLSDFPDLTKPTRERNVIPA